MLLACDIGNTRIKCGLFDKDQLVEFSSFTDLNSLFSHFYFERIRRIAVSSVVPETLQNFRTNIKHYTQIKPLTISKDSNFNLRLVYDSLNTLGIDRVCSAEGAFALFKKSNDFKNYSPETYILSIDLGTATTINFIKYPAEFIGGIIAPGISMMFESLNKRTAQLPNVEESDYKSLIGSDTKSSIASGVISSTIGLIEQSVIKLKTNHRAETIKIFLTGGNAEKITKHLRRNFIHEKALVLYGINEIAQINVIL